MSQFYIMSLPIFSPPFSFSFINFKLLFISVAEHSNYPFHSLNFSHWDNPTIFLSKDPSLSNSLVSYQGNKNVALLHNVYPKLPWNSSELGQSYFWLLHLMAEHIDLRRLLVTAKVKKEHGLETHSHSHSMNPDRDPPLLLASHSGCLFANICSLLYISTSFYLHITQDPEGATLSSQAPGNRFLFFCLFVCAVLCSFSVGA